MVKTCIQSSLLWAIQRSQNPRCPRKASQSLGRRSSSLLNNMLHTDLCQALFYVLYMPSLNYSYSDPRHRYYCYSHFPGGNPSSDCLATSTVTRPVKEAKPSLPDHRVLALCALHRTASPSRCFIQGAG